MIGINFPLIVIFLASKVPICVLSKFIQRYYVELASFLLYQFICSTLFGF